MKTKEQLNKLTTKRLLSYYKVERKKMIIFKYNHSCEFNLDYDWEISPETDYSKMLKKRFDDKVILLSNLKEILDTREHIKK